MQKSSLILFSVCFNFYSYNFIHFVHAVFVSKKGHTNLDKDDNLLGTNILDRRVQRYKTLGEKPILNKK